MNCSPLVPSSANSSSRRPLIKADIKHQIFSNVAINLRHAFLSRGVSQPGPVVVPHFFNAFEIRPIGTAYANSTRRNRNPFLPSRSYSNIYKG